ncbi:glycosyltransferase [bacterium]|nr:glycosyltransferase [bacterium]
MSKKKILIATGHLWNNPSIRVGDHHYAELFAKDNWEVFWISHPISPLHLFKKGNFLRIKNWLNGVQKKDEVFHYTPLTCLPYYKKLFNKKWIGKNNLKFTIPSIKNVLNKYNFLNVDILWITDLSMYYLTKIIHYKKMVLRLVDDLPMYNTSPKSIKGLQNDLIRRADYVFVTSKNLMKYQNPDKENFFYIPNGVDLNHFKKQSKMPPEYQKIKSPRILFVGGIYQWVSKDLLKYAASKLADYNFILIGPSGINLSDIESFKNVFYLGPKSYNEIPAYMQYADVGIVPFRENKLTKSVSPIKMFEYLASGLPVVSTRILEAESLDPPVYFAKDPEEFIKYLREALMKGKNVPEFFEFAKSNSWRMRYKKILKVLDISKQNN